MTRAQLLAELFMVTGERDAVTAERDRLRAEVRRLHATRSAHRYYMRNRRAINLRSAATRRARIAAARAVETAL